ncbi:hypothetical protein CCY99_06760 [Helicobacter sp. 16-1353]|uniref:DUF2018 family protein n=1 Tax=Helicobacter sp. 16-1353 TaxID=2004996 RepID=UPI000DCC8729|nr:DUF2018 family protein [Helicobacter sp. 16-1353]RAX53061.1 hypothetical protein CCY99_06760 [Helicobacter sp. 16-1353]
MYRDDIFDGEPIEHLVKILQNGSPQAIKNSIEALFSEYAILELIAEKGLSDEISDIKINYKDHIEVAKQDLAIRLMSNILSQE